MKGCPDTVRGLDAPSRLNKATQTTTDEYLWALYTFLKRDRPYQDRFAGAYVVNSSSQQGKGDGVRIKILIRARDGRNICIWQPRKHFGPLHLIKVWNGSDIYSYLRANLAKQPASTMVSLEAASLFLNTLGEGVADRREVG